MSWLDSALLAGAILCALAAMAGRTGRPARACAVLVLLAAGCVLQVVAEGWYWQFVPVYALILLAALRMARGARRTRWQESLVCAGLLGGAGVLAASWVFLPVPGLPAPHGPYAVGTQVFRWVDATRPEPATRAPGDRRNLVVQAWYPAAHGAGGVHAAYIDGLGRLPDAVAGMPGAVLAHYDRIDTHGIQRAPVAADRRTWPVVLFSPGYGASRAFYTTLVSDLASRGFVVLAVDHPFEASVTQLADGRLATPVERFAANDPDRLDYMRQRLEVRTADLRAVLDRLAHPDGLGSLAGRLDLARIAAVGHSFGGAASVAIASTDERVRAAVNLDGTLYGTLAERQLDRPFLLIESDRGETRHSALYLQGNRRLIAHLQSAGFRYQIAQANHYSFTDVPLLLSPPARWLLAKVMGGARGPAETVHASVDLLAAFLQGRPADLQAVAGRYRRIEGGPAGPSG
ncbi:alpha/beta fold hydrolase [Pseudoduganella chitinolytica]|uniref:Dienelactone hydrolase family protein n=1 Tax=Pseudoduganella chitinolytica TaxID=34070 RepID=A0ABY8BJI6_9BURK|nr:alpha/beta fold hydrolase [Pseudoduganella chitinolytica]WEF35128.1 dienelactone hydrolase family protein [Pseudoduganella chitinolytica]